MSQFTIHAWVQEKVYGGTGDALSIFFMIWTRVRAEVPLDDLLGRTGGGHLLVSVLKNHFIIII